MKEEKQKTENRRWRSVSNILFALIFVGMLLYPFLRLDTTEVIDSETENRRMTMWPGFYPDGSYNEWYGHYVEDRVAFREEAVRVYMDSVYALFGEFAEKLHMYGKKQEIFPADEGYLAAYQHLATDEALIDDLVTYLDRSNRYLKQKHIPFVFLAGLDKKTVYPEYMPDDIHVDESRESIMENLSRKLDEKQVPYVIPVEEFRAAATRDENRIYNQTCDSAHWNENGLMLALSLLQDEIIKQQKEISGDTTLTPIRPELFKKKTETARLEFLSLPLTEEVPVYDLRKKQKKALVSEDGFIDTIEHIEGPYVMHLSCENAATDQTILVFGDSFLQSHMHLFCQQYHDVYGFGRQNYEHLQLYVETLQPDVVVFENAERAFVDDLYNYTNLAGVTYPGVQ
ncbi:MAG: hypothetical protein K6E18_09265 [Lachnospiraceae bacterium]|nr:hypothetical protein [Lachnospiraceae bacterium]